MTSIINQLSFSSLVFPVILSSCNKSKGVSIQPLQTWLFALMIYLQRYFEMQSTISGVLKFIYVKKERADINHFYGESIVGILIGASLSSYANKM